jgi:hypothetical protein
MGSPFTALLCETAGERLDRGSEVGRHLLDWAGDPGGWADGVPLRLCGGLHALVRSGKAPDLALCYPPRDLPNPDRLWTAVDSVLRAKEDFLLAWLSHPPQTNEVGRAAALMSGMLVAASVFRLPIRLFELGASAGLNLILDRYGYDLGGVKAGDTASPLQLKPHWQGQPPPSAKVEIVGRSGVDLRPMDPGRDRDRLLAFVWPDQQSRIATLETALAIAAKSRPSLDQADAADWLEARLGPAPEPGVTRVVMHSVAYQYFPAGSQARIAARIAEAGSLASSDAPLAWLRFEKEAEDRETMLRLMLFPDGRDRVLAACQPHGSAMRWLDG